MTPDVRLGAAKVGGVATIVPFLWFENQAEEAANFYVSLFRDSRIDSVRYYTEQMQAPGRPVGSAMVVNFHLAGIELLAINGGPHYKLSPAISFTINCNTQEEIDFYWDKLSEGGTPLPCGWVTDRFGLSWQVEWSKITEIMLTDRADHVMAALMQMSKINIAELQRAYDGK